MRWVYPTACVTASAEDGVACWAVSGVITDKLLPKLIVDAFAWHEEARSKAHVADFRCAVMAVALDDYLRHASVLIKPPNWIANPMAIVPGEHEDFFRRYAMATAQRGVGRVVLTEFEQAHAWASRIALLLPSGGSGPFPHCTRNTQSSARPRGRRPSARPARPPTGLESA